MKQLDVPQFRVRTAIALSIAAHVCALWLLAILLDDRDIEPSSTVERGSDLVIMQIVHREPALAPARAHRGLPKESVAVAPHPAATAPAVQRAAPREETPAASASRAPQRSAVHEATVAAKAEHFGGSRAGQSAVVLPRVSVSLVAPTPNPVPTPAPATPTPAPSATATQAAVAASFGGLFSQNYPPALAAPSDLAAIRSRLSAPVRIRVDVDETGHATYVRFIQPVPDPELEQAIRSALLALRYVPADCNGLHCEGSMEIAY